MTELDGFPRSRGNQLAAKGRTDPLAYLLFAFDCITEALSNTIRDVSQNVPDQ